MFLCLSIQNDDQNKLFWKTEAKMRLKNVSVTFLPSFTGLQWTVHENKALYSSSGRIEYERFFLFQDVWGTFPDNLARATSGYIDDGDGCWWLNVLVTIRSLSPSYVKSIPNRKWVFYLSWQNRSSDCSGNCYRTRSNIACQFWNTQTPHSQEFDKYGWTDNKCRKANGSSAPWCYTTDPDTRWDWCDCYDPDPASYNHADLGYTFVEKAWGNLFYKTYGETTMNYLDAKAKCESERVTRKNVKKYF